MTEWKKCRKKPVVVEFRPAIPGEQVHTREGVRTAQENDYIIRGVQGEVYPIGRDIFERTYDVLETCQHCGEPLIWPGKGKVDPRVPQNFLPSYPWPEYAEATICRCGSYHVRGHAT